MKDSGRPGKSASALHYGHSAGVDFGFNVRPTGVSQLFSASFGILLCFGAGSVSARGLDANRHRGYDLSDEISSKRVNALGVFGPCRSIGKLPPFSFPTVLRKKVAAAFDAGRLGPIFVIVEIERPSIDSAPRFLLT